METVVFFFFKSVMESNTRNGIEISSLDYSVLKRATESCIPACCSGKIKFWF